MMTVSQCHIEAAQVQTHPNEAGSRSNCQSPFSAPHHVIDKPDITVDGSAYSGFGAALLPKPSTLHCQS